MELWGWVKPKLDELPDVSGCVFGGYIKGTAISLFSLFKGIDSYHDVIVAHGFQTCGWDVVHIDPQDSEHEFPEKKLDLYKLESKPIVLFQAANMCNSAETEKTETGASAFHGESHGFPWLSRRMMLMFQCFLLSWRQAVRFSLGLLGCI